jgi:hypothetical protein
MSGFLFSSFSRPPKVRKNLGSRCYSSGGKRQAVRDDARDGSS